VELNKVGIKRMVIRMVVLGEEKMEMLLVLLGELFDLKVMILDSKGVRFVKKDKYNVKVLLGFEMK